MNSLQRGEMVRFRNSKPGNVYEVMCDVSEQGYFAVIQMKNPTSPRYGTCYLGPKDRLVPATLREEIEEIWT